MILFVCLNNKSIEILSKHKSIDDMFDDEILNRFPNGTIDFYKKIGIPDQGFFDISKWPKLRYSIVDTNKCMSSNTKESIFFSDVLQTYRDRMIDEIMV